MSSTAPAPDVHAAGEGGGAARAQPRLAILLCTYQGARFLPQQLDSITAQTYAGWKLWASDDGSTDGTVGILEAYRARWGGDRLSIRKGPAQGFRANFLALACDAFIEADYYAYCDQDDLWDADKLAVALQWLAAVPRETPALYCARTRLIDADNRTIGLSALFSRPFAFANALVQSGAGGNTMVFNAAARALLVEAGADVAVQTHDWWTYMLVSGCGGRVYYDYTPRVGYRQHGSNLVGSNTGWLARSRRAQRILTGQFTAMNERNLAALQRVRHRLAPESLRVLDEFARARGTWLVPRVLGILRSGVYCQTRLTNLALAAAALLKKL